MEELANYFDYAYPKPETAEKPFKACVVVHNSPWSKDKKLIHIGVQGYSLIDRSIVTYVNPSTKLKIYA